MAFKMKNPSMAKMVKMAGNNRVAAQMKAEEAAAVKMKKAAVKLKQTPEGGYGKKHDKLRAKGHEARDKAMDAFDAGKEKKADRLDRRADKKLGKARDIRVKSAMKLDQKKANKPSPTEKPQPAILRKDKATSEKVGKAMAKGAVAGAKSSAKRTSPTKLKDKATERAEKRANRSNARKLKRAEKKNEFQVSYTPGKKKKKSAMKLSEADKKKAVDNAMPAAEVKSMSKESMAGAKKYGFMNKGGSFNQDKAKTELRRLSNMTGQTDSNRAKQAEIRKLIKAFS